MRRLFAPRALSFETIFGHDLTREEGLATGRMSVEQARRNPWVWACQSLISGAIANLPTDVIRKVGESRTRLPAPDWMVTPNPQNPNFTAISYKRQVALSLLQDGNAFIAVYPDVFDPQQLIVLNPSQVEIRDDNGVPLYVVTDGTYRQLELARLSPLNCLHIPFILPPGYNRGLNPIESSALTIGIDLAAQKQASKFLAGGGLVSGVIEVPREAGALTQEQVDGLRNQFKRKREGPSGYSIGVLEGGATFKSIQPSQAESEYIANRKLSREEIAGIYLIPPFFIGSEEPAAAAYASTEARAQHLIDYCLMHYTGPIEKGHDRLIGGSDTVVQFNYNALLRGDIKSRYEAYSTGLQNKFLYLEDVWAKEDLDPNRGGTNLETPNNNGVPQATPAARELPAPSVTVTSAPVNVTVPPAPRPVAAPVDEGQTGARALAILKLLEDEEDEEPPVAYDLDYDDEGHVRSITERTGLELTYDESGRVKSITERTA
jgi:HK97 family phage portal protein